MKNFSLIILSAAVMLCTSCYTTRILTEPYATTGYSTTVTYPATTISTSAYATNDDLCLNLDLQAVAAAFAQSSTPREFEILLNNSSYMISNLDLNGDGYVDYLRVLESLDGNAHIFLIQAVLGNNIYQDVATLIVENPSLASCYVEIIGDPYIYGSRYIVHPIFRTRPYMYSHLCGRRYSPWRSPWHWDYYPSYYHRPHPQMLGHYQAYVDTYMRDNRYCREMQYPGDYHYKNYNAKTRDMQRNDYASQHPEKSFNNRTSTITARTANAGGENSAVRRAQNARDVRAAQEANTKTTTTQNNTRRTATAATSGSNSRTANTSSSASRSTSTTAASSTHNTGSTTRNAGATTRSTSTATRSTGNTTGTATRSTGSTGSATRSTGTTTRSTGSTGSATRSTGTTTRSTGSTSSATRSTGTSTTSRVNNSGAARTTTSTSRSSASSSSSRPTSSSSTRSTSSSSSSRSSSTVSRSSSSSSHSSSSSASRSSSSSSSSRSGSSSSSSSSSSSRRR